MKLYLESSFNATLIIKFATNLRRFIIEIRNTCYSFQYRFWSA
jgi:hypothetical protein